MKIDDCVIAKEDTVGLMGHGPSTLTGALLNVGLLKWETSVNFYSAFILAGEISERERVSS